MVADLIRQSEQYLKSDIERFRTMNYEALAQAREHGERESEAHALRNIAIGERYQQNFSLARNYAQQARKISLAIGNPGLETEILGALGRIELDAGNREKAREYYKESLVVQEKCGQRPGKVMALISLGGMALDDQQFDTARKYFEAAQVIYEQEGNEEGIAGLRINFSMISMESDDHDSAIVQAVGALRTFEKLQQPRNIIFAEINLGRIMARIANIRAARSYFETALERAKELHFETLVSEIERELSALSNIFPPVAAA